jgi:hypothetical protein
MVVGIGIQFLLNDVQVVVGPLTHRDKPFEELEDTEVALGRAETTRRARGCCGRRWWRRSLRMKS